MTEVVSLIFFALNSCLISELYYAICYLKESYRCSHLSVYELFPPLLLPVLEGVDVEVDRAVEGGEEVADGGDVGQPLWPRKLYSLINIKFIINGILLYNLLLHLLLGIVPRYWGSTSLRGNQ